MNIRIGDRFEWTFRDSTTFVYEVVSSREFIAVYPAFTKKVFEIGSLGAVTFEEYFDKVNSLLGHTLRLQLTSFEQFVRDTLEDVEE